MVVTVANTTRHNDTPKVVIRAHTHTLTLTTFLFTNFDSDANLPYFTRISKKAIRPSLSTNGFKSAGA